MIALLPKSRVAIVTGANHGIGAATAIALAKAGTDVLVTFFRTGSSGHEADGLEPVQASQYERQRANDALDVVGAIKQNGRRGVVIEADLTDPKTPSRLFDEAEAALGPVNVLVHNASGWAKDSFSPEGIDVAGRANKALSVEAIDQQFQVDARAGALLLDQFITRHRSRNADWGRIVTLTSGEGKGFPGEVSYGAAKAALISYTFSAASEMAADGVTANVVYPPVTDTGWITDEVRAFVEKDSDHHHIAAPQEVANVICWLCTEAGRLVNGNLLRLR